MVRLLSICLISLCLICPKSYGVIQEDLAKIKAISDEVVRYCDTDEEKVLALSHYVHYKISADETKGITPQMAMSITDRLDCGVGWCNHQVAVFMALAQAQHIQTRMLYLLNKEGTSSPHTIGEAYVNGRWVVVDSQNDFNEIFSRYEALENPDLIKRQQHVKDRFANQPIEKLNEFVDMYTNPAIFVYGLDGL